MADVVVTLKVMPKGVDVDLNALAEKVKEKVSAFGGEVGKVEEKPVAFGLKSLIILLCLKEKEVQSLWRKRLKCLMMLKALMLLMLGEL